MTIILIFAGLVTAAILFGALRGVAVVLMFAGLIYLPLPLSLLCSLPALFLVGRAMYRSSYRQLSGS